MDSSPSVSVIVCCVAVVRTTIKLFKPLLVAILTAWKEWISALVDWWKDDEQRFVLPTSPIPSPMEYLGLYRLHQIANVLIHIVVAAFLLRAMLQLM